MRALIWFRNDLRISDQPALVEAVRDADEVLGCYLLPSSQQEWLAGGASQAWLFHSLTSFKKSLKELGLDLILRRGEPGEELLQLLKESQADAVYWNRRLEPESIREDEAIERTLKRAGIRVNVCSPNLLFEPEAVLKNDGSPYQVFTPYWKAALQREAPRTPLPPPKKQLQGAHKLPSLKIEELDLLPQSVHWEKKLFDHWTPGEEGAKKQLQLFLNKGLLRYSKTRNIPADQEGTSRISPYLHFGEISPQTLWKAVSESDAPEKEKECYLRELGWREFAHHLLFYFPKMTREPLKEEFNQFPWREDSVKLEAWQRGRTGYPLVDAGMRELWETGWMHNRVRMVVGSFLVKDLKIHWLEGARWFWDTLVDADLANNTMGWQWVAGSGADAAPFFRVFNPTSQGKKFDPEGEYIRRWVPELREVPKEIVHEPDLFANGYPPPIVDHANERVTALEAYKMIRGES